MSNPLQNVYKNVFENAYQATLQLADSIPEEKRYKQLKEGKAHPLWLIGHIANTNNLVVNRWCCEGESQLPKEYIKMFGPDFGGGAPPTSDASFYPSWDEVVDSYRKLHEACTAGIATLTEEQLLGDLRGGAPDAMKERFGSVSNTILSMVGHDNYHRGQMAMINAL